MSIIASIHGRAGQDGELRQSQSGKPWYRLSIVCQAGQTRDGEPNDVWVTLVAFGTKAEDLAKVSKGGMVSAIGRLELSRWVDREGAARESWQLIVDELLTARSARPGGRGKAQGGAGSREALRASQAVQAPSSGAPFDDPLPF